MNKKRYGMLIFFLLYGSLWSIPRNASSEVGRNMLSSTTSMGYQGHIIPPEVLENLIARNRNQLFQLRDVHEDFSEDTEGGKIGYKERLAQRKQEQVSMPFKRKVQPLKSTSSRLIKPLYSVKQAQLSSKEQVLKPINALDSKIAHQNDRIANSLATLRNDMSLRNNRENIVEAMKDVSHSLYKQKENINDAIKVQKINEQQGSKYVQHLENAYNMVFEADNGKQFLVNIVTERTPKTFEFDDIKFASNSIEYLLIAKEIALAKKIAGQKTTHSLDSYQTFENSIDAKLDQLFDYLESAKAHVQDESQGTLQKIIDRGTQPRGYFDILLKNDLKDVAPQAVLPKGSLNTTEKIFLAIAIATFVIVLGTVLDNLLEEIY